MLRELKAGGVLGTCRQQDREKGNGANCRCLAYSAERLGGEAARRGKGVRDALIARDLAAAHCSIRIERLQGFDNLLCAP